MNCFTSYGTLSCLLFKLKKAVECTLRRFVTIAKVLTGRAGRFSFDAAQFEEWTIAWESQLEAFNLKNCKGF